MFIPSVVTNVSRTAGLSAALQDVHLPASLKSKNMTTMSGDQGQNEGITITVVQ